MNDAKTGENVGEGRYLYCVTNHGTETDFGKIGLENNNVYAVSYKDMSVIVHNCLAKPYESKEEEKVKSLLFSHLYVIDAATRKFGTVVPFAFDTIIKGSEGNVREWLSKEYPRLKNNLERLEGKEEYDIQVFLDVTRISEEIESTHEEAQKLKNDIEMKPKGIAHMLQKKLEMIIKDELRRKAEEYSKEIYDQVKEHVEEIKTGKIIKIENGKWKEKEMILNLSCLVHNSNTEALGSMLERVSATNGFSVRFAGPWAPYNFVS